MRRGKNVIRTKKMTDLDTMIKFYITNRKHAASRWYILAPSISQTITQVYFLFQAKVKRQHFKEVVRRLKVHFKEMVRYVRGQVNCSSLPKSRQLIFVSQRTIYLR